MEMTVRPARKEDLPKILELYAVARRFMKEHGNPDQWGDTHPDPELPAGDIERGEGFVVLRDGKIAGTFALMEGPDPTYTKIEDGAWLTDAPYHVVHRIAGDGKGGVFDAMLRFAKARGTDLRIDTHEKNTVMRHLLLSRGFIQCGIIYVRDHSPRIAYQKKAMPESTESAER